MESDKSASVPPAVWSKEKSNMGQDAPPPYEDDTTAWSQQPPQGYAPQPPQGYPPQPPQGYPLQPFQGYPPQPQGYGAPPFHNQGPGYGQQMNQDQTVIEQPKHHVVPTPLENPVRDYLSYSIFTLLCCCMPLGVAALIYSILTREANHFGDRGAAERSSRIARKLNHVAVGLGIGVTILIIVYFAVMMTLVHH